MYIYKIIRVWVLFWVFSFDVKVVIPKFWQMQTFGVIQIPIKQQNIPITSEYLAVETWDSLN